MNIAIITACPSGVANSILAAGLLEQAAAKLGWEAKIECQSSVIAPTPLTDADIEQADAIVIAANTTVDTSRFVGKKSLPSRNQLGGKRRYRILDDRSRKCSNT